MIKHAQWLQRGLCLLAAIFIPLSFCQAQSAAALTNHAIFNDLTVSQHYQALLKAAPTINHQALAMALFEMQKAQTEGYGLQMQRFAVIDYGLSSRLPRLWLFDLTTNRLLLQTLVAHGQGSGGDIPHFFSNANDSHATSLGLFLTQQTYIGHNGLSLHLQGLEAGFNDAAQAREVVVHGATYVNNQIGQKLGRIGRSWGCMAVSKPLAKEVIDWLKNGQFIYAYAPQNNWLNHSSLAHYALVNCQKNLYSSMS